MEMFCISINLEYGSQKRIEKTVATQRSQQLIGLPSHVQKQDESAEFIGVNERIPGSDSLPLS